MNIKIKSKSSLYHLFFCLLIFLSCRNQIKDKQEQSKVLDIKFKKKIVSIDNTGSYEAQNPEDKIQNKEEIFQSKPIIETILNFSHISPHTKSRNFSLFFTAKLKLNEEILNEDIIITYRVDGQEIGKVFQIFTLKKNKYIEVNPSENSKYSKLKTFIPNLNEDIYELDCRIVLTKMPKNYKTFELIISRPNIKEIYEIDIQRFSKIK